MKPAEVVSKTLFDFIDIERSPIIVWLKKNFGQERFLIDDPIKLSYEQNFHIIAGMTENEFIDPSPKNSSTFLFYVLLEKTKKTESFYYFLYKTYFSL